MSIISAELLLVLVMDPLGNIPLFLEVLGKVDPSRHKRVVLREMCIALVVLILFLFAGRYILHALQISEPSLSIAGGTILLLIAIGMVFPMSKRLFAPDPHDEPFIVPLAVPLIAGPSAVATVMLLMSQVP